MAELNARIIAKASATASEEPQAADLEVAELAVNTADGKLFTKHTDGSIVTISGSGTISSLGDIGDVDTSTTPPTDGQALIWDSAAGSWEPGTVSGGAVLPSVNGWTIDSDSTAATSQVLNTPAHSAGDLLVACIMSRVSGGTPTPPAGWALYGEYLASLPFDQTISVYTKIATASEPATNTWTQASSTRICGFIAAVSGAGSISSVIENYGNGATASISTVSDNLNITAATWVYAATSGTESYSQSGPGLTEITDSPVADARVSGGYTTEAGTVTSTHATTATTSSPNHGMIAIRLASAASISDNDDVDTVSTPPTDGQVLTWVDANSQWEPATPSGGGGATSIADLSDVLLPVAEYGTWDTLDGGAVSAYTDGDFYPGGGDYLYLASGDASGTDYSYVVGNTEYWYSYDATNWTHISSATITSVTGQLALTPRTGTSTTAPIYVAFADPGNSSAEFLKYDRTNAQYQASTISLGDMADADTSTTPPTDGQVLTWVDANSQWEPATPSGGGGGATELDDLTDVAAGLVAGTATWTGSWTISTLASGQVMSSDGNMGPGSGSEVNLYINDGSGTDLSSELSSLNGSTLYWRKNSGAWQSETMTSYRSFATTTLIPEAAGLSTSVNAAQLGDTYELADGVPGVDYTPTDGQVLTWVDANNQWEPVTPSGGGGGATELDDLTDVTIPSETETGQYSSTSSFPSAQGAFRMYTVSSPDVLQLNKLDNDGTDWSATLAAVKAGDTFQTYVDGSPGTVETVTAVSDAVQRQDDPNVYDIELSDADGALVSSTNRRFIFGSSPSDGQVLTWVDANNQWEPAVPSVASVNTQTGAVSLGIQDMNDFELNSAGGATYTYTSTADSTPSAGVASIWTGDFWSINVVDNNGVDWQSQLYDTGLFVNGISTVVLVNGSTVATTTTTSISNRNSSRVTFTLADVSWHGSLVDGDEIVFQWVGFPTESYTALVDGDILQWVAAESLFKPAQLPASGTQTIDDLSDVDTATTPPTDGQVLTWVNANSQWEPADASGSGAVDSVNGQTGTVSLGLDDIADVSVATYSTARGTDFDTGDLVFRDKQEASATGGSLDTSLGTNAWKIVPTDYYGTSESLNAMFVHNRRYEIVCIRIRSDQAFDTNNRMSIGGNKPSLVPGAGWSIYTRDAGFGFYADNAFQEIGTMPTMSADTWYEVTYVLDWGSSQRASLPAVSLWVDGAIAINNVTPTPSYSESTSVDFSLAYSSSSQSNSGNKFIDFVRVAGTDTLPWGMTDATLTDTGRNLTDAITATLAMGDFLIYNGSNWVPSGHALTDDNLLAQGLGDLTDVTYDAASGNLQIDGLDSIFFSSNDVPGNGADDDWGIYANSSYGVIVGEYNVTNPSNATRTLYTPSTGVIHNSGRTQLHWLMGPFSSTSNTPELRFTSGNPQSSSGNYIGFKLPSGISANTTFTLPAADGSSGQMLSTDGAGVLSWADAPITDPLFNLVTVLTPFDGETNGAATWTTYGSTSPTWTVGGATITNAGTRWGGTTSLNISGATTVGVPCSLGSDDWTVEAWFYIDTDNWNGFGLALGNGVLADAHDTVYFGPFSNISGTQSCRLRLSNNGVNLGEKQETSGVEWRKEEWMHVAITRLENRYTAFVNGKQAATVDMGATNLTFDSGTMGTNTTSTGVARMQDFRITRGVARYSGAYYAVPAFALPTS